MTFLSPQLVVRAWESRLIFKDIQYGSVKVDLADMEFTLPSVTETFSNEEKNVKVFSFFFSNHRHQYYKFKKCHKNYLVLLFLMLFDY